MTAVQEAELGMFDEILSLCSNNPTTVAVLLAFKAGAAKLADHVKDIKAAAKIQAAQSTGAGNKKQAKNDLAKITLTVADAVSAYATEIGNVDLKSDVSYSLSELKDMRDEDLPTVAAVVKEKAEDVLANLSGYGITAATITSLGDAISNFAGKNTDPGAIKAQKKVATQNIKQYIKDADQVLEETMDKLVGQLAATDAEFVKQYHELRKIVDPATTKTSVAGTIFNELTGEPLYDAVFQITGGNSDKSDVKGKYIVPEKEGVYDCKVEKEGFITKDLAQVVITKGKVTKLDIKLTPGS